MKAIAQIAITLNVAALALAALAQNPVTAAWAAIGLVCGVTFLVRTRTR